MNMENTNQSTLYPSEPGFAPAGPVRVGGVIFAEGRSNITSAVR